MNTSSSARLIGFDMDSNAIEFARRRLGKFGDRVLYVHDSFASLRKRLHAIKVNRIRGLLLDLGISSRHINEANRGFSFQQDSRLDMRMDQRNTLDAWTVINNYDQDRLTHVLQEYGEERLSRRIAKAIIAKRKHKGVDTTRDLAAIVEAATGRKFLQKSLARIFQAIRIEVNDELENLRIVLRDAMDVIDSGGRIVVISYHSLEDRIVKEFFRKESRRSVPSGTKLLPDRPLEPRLKVLTKRPIVPEPLEIAQNDRARSAKLRAAERI